MPPTTVLLSRVCSYNPWRLIATALPIRILAVIIEMHGGAAMVLRNLAAGLHRYYPGEFQIDLLSIRKSRLGEQDNELFESITTLALPVHRGLSRLTQIPWQALAIKKAIAHLNPDLVLASGTYPNLIVPFVASGRACVLAVHSNTTRLLESYRFKALPRWLIETRYSKCPVVVPSQGVADDLKENFSVSTARVIPHGIDLDRVRELSMQPVSDLPQAPYLITVGNFFPAKDHATLLAAYAIARKQGLSLDLVIVGEGPLLERLQQMARDLNIGGNVHFIGYRDNPYPYLRAAKFFVLSSIFEGFGLWLVEAMALGLLCISTDCPSGPGEILENGAAGILVPPSHPEELAGAMLRLVNSPELQSTLSQKSLGRAEQFTLQRMADNYRKLFLEFARDHRR